MQETFVNHKILADFADKKVNLKTEDVTEYRGQVNRLRSTLTDYINEHPHYSLIKMLHSGSVMKGTALKTINDMDVAVYISKADAPSNEGSLQSWLAERLRECYPNFKPDQFEPQSHCVTVKFLGSGLNVDVVPVLYEDGENDRGFLITKDFGDRVLTSIPLHLEFIRSRKQKQPHHFRQIVRFVKQWVRQQRLKDESFRFKSFMVELICAHLVDKGIDMSDYPVALKEVFGYIVKSGLKSRISFTDYYKASDLPSPSGTPMEIFDPVNPENNVAKRYTEQDRARIFEAAYDAFDAITEAHHATTKARSLSLWKEVFGPSFNF